LTNFGLRIYDIRVMTINPYIDIIGDKTCTIFLGKV